MRQNFALRVDRVFVRCLHIAIGANVGINRASTCCAQDRE